jgi:biopolymer transport protein ExbD
VAREQTGGVLPGDVDMARKLASECTMDMTPMIDCVFQLIIFFIVTINMEDRANPDIELPPGIHGPAIKTEDEKPMIIEVDKRGRISMQNLPMSLPTLKNLLNNRRNRVGQFPVMIRGDMKAQHKEIRAVMDTCTGVGIWRINFAAIKEKKVKRGS